MKHNKKKLVWMFVLIIIFALCVISSFRFLPNESDDTSLPMLAIETPQKIRVSTEEPVLLDVSISSLGEVRYPAMSASIDFDPLYLEFLGIEEGNVFVHDDISNNGKKLPEWSYNVEESNHTGQIHLIYLDITGGKYAFDHTLLEGENHILFRLKFRLRNNATAGDVYELNIDDAVFAATDDSQSLAVLHNTLKTKNSKLVIGE